MTNRICTTRGVSFDPSTARSQRTRLEADLRRIRNEQVEGSYKEHRTGQQNFKSYEGRLRRGGRR